MNLVALVGTDKENWGQITALINRMECEHIFLVINKDVVNFPTNEKCSTIELDSSVSVNLLKQNLLELLRPALNKDFEIALSLASGTGKEHMAIVSALLNIPVGIRLVVYTKEGVQFLT